MLQNRVIPVLLLTNGSLVKTKQFKSPTYIGDPVNTALIFNELEADELVLLDISPTVHQCGPDFKTLQSVASECFMPLAYGGGISSCEQGEKILNLGFEKIVINSSAIEEPNLISNLAHALGSQAVVVGVDFRRMRDNSRAVFSRNGRRRAELDLVSWCRRAEMYGAGELLLTSIDSEGTWSGYDLPAIKEVASAVGIPVIANGGAGSLADIESLFFHTGALGAGVGSMFVFQGRGKGVLVNMPSKEQLRDITKTKYGSRL